MAPQLAWIGLGNMGRGMCNNLVEKGQLDAPLVIFNRTQQRAVDLHSKLPSGKSTVASTLEEAVSKADMVFTCLGDDKAIKDTIEIGLKTDVEGKLFVDCSTVHPDTTNILAKSIQDQGAEMAACPVFGAPAMADAGQLICVLAGSASAPQGKATLFKTIGNTFILNMVETFSEGHALADKSGLGNDNLHQFIETTFPGPYIAYSGRLMSGDYYKLDEPLFGVDLARKDAQHALDLAAASATKLKDFEVADIHLAAVQKHMGSQGDIAGIYGAVRQEAGLNFEN